MTASDASDGGDFQEPGQALLAEIEALTVELHTSESERREHEQALRHSEARFRDFADASSDWFWEMDETLRFSYFSDRFTGVTGVPQEALLGKTREETGIPGVDPEVWRDHMADLEAHRPFRNFIHPRLQPDGRTVIFSINGKPVYDERGRFQGYRGTGSDITSRRNAEAESERTRALLAAKDLAEIANRAKSEFLANMSHELRTPLNAIIGFSEIIQEERLGPINHPRYRDYIDDIHASGRLLLELINDILDLSKLEAGNADLDEDVIDMQDALRACSRLVADRAGPNGPTLNLDPQPGPHSALRADPRMVKQILTNLLSNAVKFTPPEGTVTARIWSDPGMGYAIEIADTGIGMAPEDIPRALARFEQLDGGLSRRHQGSGLGLPLTKALVELHGGTLALESELGVGTTVTVLFSPDRIVRPNPASRRSRRFATTAA